MEGFGGGLGRGREDCCEVRGVPVDEHVVLGEFGLRGGEAGWRGWGRGEERVCFHSVGPETPPCWRKEGVFGEVDVEGFEHGGGQVDGVAELAVWEEVFVGLGVPGMAADVFERESVGRVDVEHAAKEGEGCGREFLPEFV